VHFVDLLDPSTDTTTMLYADPLDIRVTGLPPGAEVTLTARFVGWGSTTVFDADASGTLDVATASAKSGSYTGVDIDGVVWSMTKGTSPTDTGQDPYALRVSATVGGVEMANGALTRLAKATDVQCMDVTTNGLVGTYCAKQGAAPRGALVTFGGSEGGLSTGKELAMYYASLGYPSLGLAYFSAPGLPATLTRIPLEYFDKAFDWVEARPEVMPGKIVVQGGSRGGELALLLGAKLPRVTGVIALLPSAVLWGAPQLDGSEVASWTYQGADLPWVPYLVNEPETKIVEPDGVTAYGDSQIFLDSLAQATPTELDQATSRVENTKGPILMIAGESDQLWAACDLTKAAQTRLASSGHSTTYADSFVCYPDAGHNVTPFSVGVPTTAAMHSYTTEFGEYLALGGTPAGIAHASRDADLKMRAFLAANL
jgi:dienelactone hydrolase